MAQVADENIQKEKPHEDDVKLKSDDFTPPGEVKRRSTDCLFLLAIIASWIAMTFIGLAVFGAIDSDELDTGDPDRLFNAIDYRGRICGVDDGVKDLPNAYYLVNADVICVKSCPSRYASSKAKHFICKDDVEPDNLADAWQKVNNAKCMPYIDTTEGLNRCLFTDSLSDVRDYIRTEAKKEDENVNTSKLSDSGDSDWLTKFASDLWETFPIAMGFGIGVALIFGFIYIMLLRIPGLLTILVWSILFAVFFCLLLIAIMSVATADAWADDDPQKRSDADIVVLRTFGYIMLVFAILWLCFMVWFRKRIALAIGVIKEASRALSYMRSITLLPVIQALGVGLFLIPWMFYTVYLFSSGDVDRETGNLNLNDNARYAFLYLLFEFFWTTQFVIAVGQLIVAVAVSIWYFTREKKNTGVITVQKAFRIVLRYHLGTAAFGSLIIAIIKTVRAIVAYIQKKVAKRKPNFIIKCILCCVQCCLWCLEKIMKFLNKNAYIQTAIFGYSFCKASRKSFFLIARNIARVAAVGVIGDFVLMVGKLLIPLATTFLAYLVFTSMQDKLNGLFWPLFVVFLFSYMVAVVFNELFGMSISTILQCFIADEEFFGNGGGEPYADGALTKMIEDTKRSAASTKVQPEEKTEKEGVEAAALP